MVTDISDYFIRLYKAEVPMLKLKSFAHVSLLVVSFVLKT
jgi:hypothetical protein